VKVGEEFSFVADGPSLTCECGTANFFRVDDLKEGYTLSCRGCQATIEFVAQQWQYRIIAAGKGDPESSSEEP
jgi:hypothetical protein